MTTLFLFITGLLAGSFGALLGLGGGVIVIPVLTMLFDLPIHTAVGVSLVGVIATSTGAAIIYVREGKADIRLGMTLELGTTVGAVAGAVIAGYVSPKVLYLLFAAMLFYNTYAMYRRGGEDERAGPENGENKGRTGIRDQYRNIPQGVLLSSLAGIMSGLLGVGGGLIKIPVMYFLMGVPLKIAAATSNFMIGVTASASALIYFLDGRIEPLVAVPVALGIFGGAIFGTWMNDRISTGMLRKVFMVVFIYIALQMFSKGLGS
ncbi:MAG: sulfite exporter TauE/SafE family protein [Firmicutes bacterium HGW-Firmicutes-14]|nr:MAG: sulfite exporter TauE/SafE family protein [Firmicutes bacterium HGW-Firmicutes-14]